MKKLFVLIILIILSGILLILFNPFRELIINKEQISNMKLLSSVFQDGQKIPVKYTCNGDGINPPLEISEVPQGSQSLVLILKDPDAPLNTFIHWVLWNINSNTTEIMEDTLPSGSVQGVNSAGKNSFFSPCPPSGQHHYIFYLYALDTTLTLPPEAKAQDVEQTIVGHVLGATTLTGIFP